MMCYKIREGGKDLRGRAPIEWTHRDFVVSILPRGELLLKILKRIELVRSVKIFVVFSMAAFNFPVVSGCIRFNEFVANIKSDKCFFKKG